MDKIGFREAVRKLLALSPTVEQEGKTAAKEGNHTLEALDRTANLDHSFRRMADTYNERPEGKEYLEGKRGIRLDGIEVGYCAANIAARISIEQRKALTDIGILTVTGKPHFAGCVVFPLRDVEGRLTGLYGRKCNGESPFDTARGAHSPAQRGRQDAAPGRGVPVCAR